MRATGVVNRRETWLPFPARDPNKICGFFSRVGMLTRAANRLSSDFAHKQVSNGFSKKYGENFDKIFGKKKPTTTPQESGKPLESVSNTASSQK